MSKKIKKSDNTIAVNKKARHEFFIDETFEAGIVLDGWEVKAIRSGKVNMSESYVIMHQGEAYLHGCHITPLTSASTHVIAEPVKPRKLLLHTKELAKLFGVVSREGQTIAALKMYWKGPWVKVEIGTAQGKKLHDKRATSKDREWAREKERAMKHKVR